MSRPLVRTIAKCAATMRLRAITRRDVPIAMIVAAPMNAADSVANVMVMGAGPAALSVRGGTVDESDA